jgi:3-hydroxymyristoyl/3-hydroxydecanoyl-(acyl carrier protein) dehydratase
VNFALRWAESTRREHADSVEHRTRVEVPSDYGYFDGHFAGYPILPGAAQLSELVLPCVRRAWPELGALKQMARLKFTGRIQPGETIDVVLSARTGGTSVDFALRRAEVLCSAGTLSFTGSAGEVAR